MKRLHQQKVVDKLTRAGRKLMRDRVEHPAAEYLRDGWMALRKDVQAFVAGVWKQEQAQDSPLGARRARQRIAAYLEQRVMQFRQESREVLHTAMKQAYRLQYLLSAWIVDTATPPVTRVTIKPKSYRVSGKVRRHIGAKESAYPRSVDGATRKLIESWFDEPTDDPLDKDEEGNEVNSASGTMDTYLKAWGGSAIVQAGMSMAYGSAPEDAANAIAGAKAGTYSPESAFARIIRTQVQVAVMDAEDDFDGDNDGLTEKRIWRTMDDESVCEDCESQEGLEEDEWEFDIPAHPICRCFVERVLLPYQALQGDDAVQGVSPQAMVFHDPETGEEAGVAVVNFDEWAQKNGVSVGH